MRTLQECRERLHGIFNITVTGQPQTTKAIMNLRGFKGGSVRQPLQDLHGAARDDVTSALRALAGDPRSAIVLPA